MTPLARYQELQTELNPIQDKSSNDHKWFEVGSDKKLLLCNRHYWNRHTDFSGHFFDKIWNCFCRIQQYIRRLFCNPYSKLEKKIHELTDQINLYLKAEDDPKRRSEFLDQYGPAVSQLIHSAQKLEKLKLLKLPAIDSEAPIRQWMLADQTDLFLAAKNLNPKYLVKFDFRHGKESSYGWEKEFDKALSVKDESIQQRVSKSFKEDWLVSAQFSQKHNVASFDTPLKSVKVIIEADGEVSYLSTDTEGVFISNKSHFDLSIDLKGFTEEANTTEMHSQHRILDALWSTCFCFPTTFSAEEKPIAALRREQAENKPYKTLPPKADGVLHRLAFDIKGIQVKPMKFGCKSGQYTATVGPDGLLDVDVKAYRVIETTLSPKVIQKKDEFLLVTHSPADTKQSVFKIQTNDPLIKIESKVDLLVDNKSENFLDLDFTVKAIKDANQRFAPQFTVSNFEVPGHLAKTWSYDTSPKKQVKGMFCGDGMQTLKDPDQVEFNITLRELATQ